MKINWMSTLDSKSKTHEIVEKGNNFQVKFSNIIYYTGIGSRATPKEICDLIEKIAFDLAKSGFILRSGGAEGADSAFERGCDLANGKKQIYLPWKGFNKNKSLLWDISLDAFSLAEKYHPNWKACTDYARRLLARNGYEVLGYDLKTPTNIIVCWTENGKPTGGTSQAIRIATDKKIPIINLGNPKTLKEMQTKYV